MRQEAMTASPTPRMDQPAVASSSDPQMRAQQSPTFRAPQPDMRVLREPPPNPQRDARRTSAARAGHARERRAGLRRRTRRAFGGALLRRVPTVRELLELRSDAVEGLGGRTAGLVVAARLLFASAAALFALFDLDGVQSDRHHDPARVERIPPRKPPVRSLLSSETSLGSRVPGTWPVRSCAMSVRLPNAC